MKLGHQNDMNNYAHLLVLWLCQVEKDQHYQVHDERGIAESYLQLLRYLLVKYINSKICPLCETT